MYCVYVVRLVSEIANSGLGQEFLYCSTVSALSVV